MFRSERTFKSQRLFVIECAGHRSDFWPTMEFSQITIAKIAVSADSGFDFRRLQLHKGLHAHSVIVVSEPSAQWLGSS